MPPRTQEGLPRHCVIWISSSWWLRFRNKQHSLLYFQAVVRGRLRVGMLLSVTSSPRKFVRRWSFPPALFWYSCHIPSTNNYYYQVPVKTPKYIKVPVCSSVPRYVCTPIIKQVPDTICVDETYEKCAKVPNQVRIGQAALKFLHSLSILGCGGCPYWDLQWCSSGGVWRCDQDCPNNNLHRLQALAEYLVQICRAWNISGRQVSSHLWCIVTVRVQNKPCG